MANAGYLPGAERRRQIVGAAKRVFAARGYHQTNISHICEGLGIGRGTLYQYFDSKHQVFRAILEDLLERVRHVVETEPMPRIPAGVRLTREESFTFFAGCLRRMLDAVFADAASLRIVLREAVGLDVNVDAVLRAIDDTVVERFTSDLESAQRAGVVRGDIDPRSAAMFVMGGIQKLTLDAIGRGEDHVNLDVVVGEVTRLTLMGLLADPVQ